MAPGSWKQTPLHPLFKHYKLRNFALDPPNHNKKEGDKHGKE